MSKVLLATCDNSGKVTADGVVVDNAQVMSEGKQASEGPLFMDRDKAYYLPSSATDVKSTLEKVALALEQIATALQAIDVKPTGGTGSASTPAAAGQIAQINSIKAEIDTLKGALK